MTGDTSKLIIRFKSSEKTPFSFISPFNASLLFTCYLIDSYSCKGKYFWVDIFLISGFPLFNDKNKVFFFKLGRKNCVLVFLVIWYYFYNVRGIIDLNLYLNLSAKEYSFKFIMGVLNFYLLLTWKIFFKLEGDPVFCLMKLTAKNYVLFF